VVILGLSRVASYDGVVRSRGFASLVGGALEDLFDQSTAFGRLALVHVIMMAGDTLVTISLAGSLFFAVSPTEAKSKVLLYLLLTMAPFAVVSPVLGPLIDRSANGRRWLVIVSAGLRVFLCWSMSQHLASLWLFPEAFSVLVCSKLYGVTRGTLVPEMARTDQLRVHHVNLSASGWPAQESPETMGFAGFNAQLTLLGTVSGLVSGMVAAALLKGLGAASVLVTASGIFALGIVAALRLARPERRGRDVVVQQSQAERDQQRLSPVGDSDVLWGLGASALMRFAVGFTTFLMAFGLRREHASLSWFGVALAVSAFGSLVGLALVTRWRLRWHESTMLSVTLLVTGLAAVALSRHPGLAAQVVLAGVVGVTAAVTQPSFDAITQRLVPAGAQGRTFARFAVRQQLTWVVGALLPVAFSWRFADGDQFLGVIMLIGAVGYTFGRLRPAP
jgi:hypothetical protein